MISWCRDLRATNQVHFQFVAQTNRSCDIAEFGELVQRVALAKEVAVSAANQAVEVVS